MDLYLFHNYLWKEISHWLTYAQKHSQWIGLIVFSVPQTFGRIFSWWKLASLCCLSKSFYNEWRLVLLFSFTWRSCNYCGFVQYVLSKGKWMYSCLLFCNDLLKYPVQRFGMLDTLSTHFFQINNPLMPLTWSDGPRRVWALMEEGSLNKRGLENLGNLCFTAFDTVLILYPTVRLLQYFQSQGHFRKDMGGILSWLFCSFCSCLGGNTLITCPPRLPVPCFQWHLRPGCFKRAEQRTSSPWEKVLSWSLGKRAGRWAFFHPSLSSPWWLRVSAATHYEQSFKNFSHR